MGSLRVKRLLFHATLFCATWGYIARADICPESSSIFPCRCGSAERAIECHSVRFVEIKARFWWARASFNNRAKAYNAVIIRGHNDDHRMPIEVLEEDVFSGFQFKLICIYNTNLRRTHANAFARSYNYTKTLSLTRNKLSNARADDHERDIFDVVNRFHYIETVDLSNNYLESVPSEAFGLLPNLRALNLAFNHIRTLGDRAFADLPSLRFVRLNSNRINYISSKSLVFQESSELLEISFFMNLLNSSSFESLNDTNRPIKLNLEHNDLSLLGKDIFAPLLDKYPTGQIKVNHNPVLCECGLKWLMEMKEQYQDRVKVTCVDGRPFWALDTNHFSYCS